MLAEERALRVPGVSVRRECIPRVDDGLRRGAVTLARGVLPKNPVLELGRVYVRDQMTRHGRSLYEVITASDTPVCGIAFELRKEKFVSILFKEVLFVVAGNSAFSSFYYVLNRLGEASMREDVNPILPCLPEYDLTNGWGMEYLRSLLHAAGYTKTNDPLQAQHISRALKSSVSYSPHIPLLFS